MGVAVGGPRAGPTHLGLGPLSQRVSSGIILSLSLALPVRRGNVGHAADFRFPYCAFYPDTARLINTQHVTAVLLWSQSFTQLRRTPAVLLQVNYRLSCTENQQASGEKARTASSKKKMQVEFRCLLMIKLAKCCPVN